MTIQKNFVLGLRTIGLVGTIGGLGSMADGCIGHSERVVSNMPPEVRRMHEIKEQFRNISPTLPKAYGSDYIESFE